MSQLTPDRVRTALRQQLESMQAAGVRQLPRYAGPKPPPLVLQQCKAGDGDEADDEDPSILAQDTLPAEDAPSRLEETPMSAVADEPTPAPTLEVLRQEVAACTRCGELAATRTQTVFGGGNPRARLCFLGEAPGADEDRQGEPFVGRAGQLLSKMLVACKLSREDVYILNVLKCRPPGNRNPAPEEAQNCRPFLDRQLDLIQPEFICCLGAVAAQNLLNSTETIGRMRGKLHDYRGMKVVCTYHPAYLLRNPAAKGPAWEDLKMLMREMGTPVE
jgi:DNA polymerase